MSYAPKPIVEEIEQEEDVINRIISFLRDDGAGKLGGRTVFVYCPVSPLFYRLLDLIPSKLNRKEIKVMRNVYGVHFHNDNAMIFLAPPGKTAGCYNTANVGVFINYCPASLKSK